MNYFDGWMDDIQMLLRCKRYVERRLEILYKLIDTMESQGKDTTLTKREIEHLKWVLNRKSI